MNTNSSMILLLLGSFERYSNPKRSMRLQILSAGIACCVRATLRREDARAHAAKHAHVPGFIVPEGQCDRESGCGELKERRKRQDCELKIEKEVWRQQCNLQDCNLVACCRCASRPSTNGAACTGTSTRSTDTRPRTTSTPWLTFDTLIDVDDVVTSVK